jgi:F-type H+-transporting ATPase subunit delta
VTRKTAALRYARALFDVALREKLDLVEVDRHLAAFAELFNRHDALAKVLLNPAVPAPRKRSAVAELTKLSPMPSTVRKLLVLLAERDRLAILPDVVAAYRARLLDYQNVVRAEVITAAPLTDGRVKDIERALAAATGRRVELATRVDPTIVGGLVARVGSTVYDGSLTTQLEKMRQRLAESV